MRHFATYEPSTGNGRWISSISDNLPEPDYSSQGLETIEVPFELSAPFHVKFGVAIPGELPPSTEERTNSQWRAVRQQRDQLLSNTDWWVTVAQENNEPVPENRRAYRQALRDITKQPDPFNISWPVKVS